MSSDSSQITAKENCYRQLMRRGRRHPNTKLLAELLASWRCGKGVLPVSLGLNSHSFLSLHRYHFDISPEISESPCAAITPYHRTHLLRLLEANARNQSPSVRWITELISTACRGQNHLWEDLGVWSRASLSTLMEYNFPSLAQRNDRDMKWKKFLSREMCQQGDVYVCQAPTCDECCDFDDCFGPE